jgi:cation:H+ antiporter
MDLTAFIIAVATPDLMVQALIFAASVLVLSKSSEVVVKKSVDIANMTKIGEMVIGFLLLSIATTLPEMTVSIFAILSGETGVSIGNILGSNITDLALILAIPAIVAPISVKKGTFEKLPTILFLSYIIPVAFLAMQNIGKYVGFVLVATYFFFALYSVKKRIRIKLPKRRHVGLISQILAPVEIYSAAAVLVVGLALLLASSHFVVSSATAISEMAGIPESVIGATVIALGTSLPELSIALTAIRSKHYELTVGNVIGACLTNITFVLGMVLIFSPAKVDMGVFSTLIFFVIGTTIVSWYFFTTGRKLDRFEGIALIFIYILFIMTTFGIQLSSLGWI